MTTTKTYQRDTADTPPPSRRQKRPDLHFDDLLGQGRVDIDTQSFMRRHVAVAIQLPSTGGGLINPCSESFDPRFYLAKLHKDSSREALEEGVRLLQNFKERLCVRTDAFRREKFVIAALVEAWFKAIKADLRPQSPFHDPKVAALKEAQFIAAADMLRKRYDAVLEREARVVRLQRTMGIYKRYAWIFETASNMNSAAGGTDAAAMENAAAEYLRTMKWLNAQDGARLSIIRDHLTRAFDALIEAIVMRLSAVHTSRADTARLVNVLTSVRREGVLSDALEKRWTAASEGLEKAVRAVDVVVGAADVRTDASVTEFVVRTSNSFWGGLSHVWRLGKVLMVHDRWLRSVDGHIMRLCEAYAGVVREHVLQYVHLLSKDAVKEIAGVRARAESELQIPETCLGPLEEVCIEVLENFLRSLSGAVKSGAEYVAIQAVKTDTVGAHAARLLCSVVTEALSQVEGGLFRGKEIEDKAISTAGSDGAASEDGAEVTECKTSVDILGDSCAEAPAIFVRIVRDRMGMAGEREAANLNVAVCCTELRGCAMDMILKKVQAGSPCDVRAVQRQLRASMDEIRKIQDEALANYVELVSMPLQTLAGGLVSFPEDEVDNSVSRTIPIKIEGVSKCASELVLQLALVTITTRKRSSHSILIRRILLHLMAEIGKTLVQVLSTDKLPYHRAAQLWVDVTYVQEMVTKGAKADTEGVQSSLDGFSRVKERAVQAVVADGYSFSLADMQTLRETVVAGAVDDSMMVCECFVETWGLLREE